MSEVEVITACENVCRDFGFLSHLGEWVSKFGPAIAFLGGVILFVMQRRNDRADNLRARRLEVYQETIVSIRDLRLAIRHNATDQEIGTLLRAFELQFAKVMVSGVDDVIEAVNFARASLIRYIEASESQDSSSILDADADVEGQYFNCIHKMRIDMHFGTELTSEFSSEIVAEGIKKHMKRQ